METCHEKQDRTRRCSQQEDIPTRYKMTTDIPAGITTRGGVPHRAARGDGPHAPHQHPTFGPDNQTVLIAESLLDSRSLIPG